MEKAFCVLVTLLASMLICNGSSYARHVISTVFPKLVEPRSSTGELTLIIHAGLVLKLRRISVFADNFQVTTYSDNYKIVEQNSAKLQRELYHDPEHEAALVIEFIDDGIQVIGILGDTLRVRPSSMAERNLDGHVAHELFEIPVRSAQYDNPDKAAFQTRHLNGILESRMAAKSRKELLTITPEVHIMVDTTHSSQFDSQNRTIDYLAVFFAFVNMKFKTLSRSKLDVQLVLSRLTIFRNGNESFVQKPDDRQDIMLMRTLETLKYFVGNNTQNFRKDDLVVLLTGCDLAQMDDKGELFLGVTGFAYVGGACSADKVGIVEDMNKMFDGVHSFAHEVGHLLGMVHDEEDPPEELPGSPGGKGCYASAGNIMSPSQTLTSNHKFSVCSAEQIRVFVNSQKRKCLKNQRPRHTSNLHVTKITTEQVSPQDFCERKHPELSNVRYQKEMSEGGSTFSIKKCQIVCLDESTNNFEVHDAPDSTPCDDNRDIKMCLNKQCTIPKNITTFPKKTYYTSS
ncbi:snake venom metalloproteinase-disintegrin-like mocarhagin [Ixodes scapularis]|uniref:snake venom metalloproteinase-disintegrin-like mocarhagin n=1 Tax=Ixodes scapularis TaxID=6945 RepID=UPI001A9CF786|nr:snake venom metalloproteinase-disintegrin-like mocarhagin [Ixodes scapularis]